MSDADCIFEIRILSALHGESPDDDDILSVEPGGIVGVEHGKSAANKELSSEEVGESVSNCPKVTELLDEFPDSVGVIGFSSEEAGESDGVVMDSSSEEAG